MEIHPYEPPLASKLALVYNRAVEPVPHCYPVTDDEFAHALAPAAGAAGTREGGFCNGRPSFQWGARAARF